MRFSAKGGMALVGVIMVVMIVSSLGAAILIVAGRDSMISRDEEEALQALYTAEGGIRKIIAEMKSDPAANLQEVCKGFQNHRVGTGKIENLSCVENEDYVQITATGVSGKSRKTLVVRVSKPEESNSGPYIIFWKELYDIY